MQTLSEQTGIQSDSSRLKTTVRIVADAEVPSAHKQDWFYTPTGEPRGYIQPRLLKELWFHTGTICNLQCPFCLEGSKPGDTRLASLRLEDAVPFMDEALTMGVEQFSFTGGEPFVIKDIVEILNYALDHRPCLVLTNGTDPLLRRFKQILPLRDKPHELSFRISLDFPDQERHDAGRGKGNFHKSLKTLTNLFQSGFHVSVARQSSRGENPREIHAAYQHLFIEAGLPTDVPIVAFPDFLTPSSFAEVPPISENCIRTYKKEESSRARFMCYSSKMVLKKQEKMKVYACTLVDDDPDYDLGETLTEAMKIRVMLKHHRCYSCFAYGASCSQLD
ncbi:MAG: radical SAM protein [SAR324 cluster bacterium]|nr:radical SAM protein [SAR324 cluster bacterium]